MQNFMKTIINGLQRWTEKKLNSIEEKLRNNVADWNENDSSASSYIKNKPTMLSEFENDLYYGKTLMTIGQYDLSYDETESWSITVDKPEVLYSVLSAEYLVCYIVDGNYQEETCYATMLSDFYFEIKTSDNKMIVYIEEIGNSLYIDVPSNVVSKFVSMDMKLYERIPSDFLDSNLVNDVKLNKDTANNALELATQVKMSTDSKMNANNPVGTGAFSFGQYALATGKNSIAIGEDIEASRRDVTVIGSLNKVDTDAYGIGFGDYDYDMHTFVEGNSAYVGDGYSFNPQTGLFSLINPVLTTINSNTIPEGSIFYGCSKDENPASSSKIYVTYNVGWYIALKEYVFGARELTASPANISKGKYAFIVGNGKKWTYHGVTPKEERSNAHTLDWNGVGWFQGGLQVGGKAQDNGAKTVMLNGDKEIILASSTEGSTKKFKLTIDDNGVLTASEIETTT